MSRFAGLGQLFRAVVFRPMRREKLRTLLTIAGIAVGVAVVVAIQLSNQSALRAFRESVDAVAGRANFQVISDSGSVDESILFPLQRLWSLQSRFAPVIDIDASLDPSETPVRVLGVDLISDLHFRDYRYARIETRSSGSKVTENLESVGESLQLFLSDSVIVPETFAEQHNLRIGSRITLRSGEEAPSLTVRGILKAEGPATAFNGSLVVMDIAAAQEAFAMRGTITRVDLLVPPEHIERAVELARTFLPKGTRLERPSRRNERVEKMLRAFRINLFALSGVALLVGMFLVYNTVLISALRRRRDVGVVKTLGVSSRQIFAAFLTEGLLFGLIGSLLGLLLGVAIASVTLELIGQTISALYVNTSPGEIELTPAVIAAGLSVGLLVALAASLHPAMEASVTRPNAMIRPGTYQRVSRRGVRGRTVLALALFIGSVAAALVPAWDNIAVGGYVSVLFLVAAFSLLAPAALEIAARSLRPAMERFFGVPGTLAAVSLPASLRRTAIATAALAIAIGMMIAVALMVGSFRQTVNVWVNQTVKSDLWVRPSTTLSNTSAALFPESISADLSGIPGVAAIDRFRGRDLLFRDSIIAVGSGDFDVAMKFGDIPMVKPRSGQKALADGISRNGVMISESLAVKFDLDVDDVIELSTANGTRRFPVTGVYRDYSNDRGVVVMPRPLFVESYGERSIDTVAVFLKPGVDAEKVRREIETKLGRKYGAFVFTNRSIKVEVMRIFDQTFLITYALLIVALIVAVLGIINTLSALILERNREIALLKVMGMSRRQITGTIVLEASLIGLTAMVIGVVTGYALSWVLIYVINKQSFGWTIEFAPPLALMAACLGITLLATVLAGLVPARLANRIPMATALKQ